jgi:hypothetical protein
LISRILSTVVAMTVGVLVLADFFINSVSVNALSLYLIRTASIVAAFAVILGTINVLTVHLGKLRSQDKGWGYSIILLGAMFFTLAVGFLTGGAASAQMQQVFEVVLFPLEATLFSLMAFFVITAAYRTFRVRSFDTALFVTFGILVLLGQVPIGVRLWDQLPVIKDWVLDVPALAGARGILLGVVLGTMATGLRVLLGIDRPYVN